MGLFLTLLFILTAYLEPQTLFGPLVQYHVEVVIAVFTLVASFFTNAEWGLFKMPQTYALIGFTFAVCMSIVMTGWLGGGLDAILGFLPNAFAFVFVAMNCRKARDLKMIVVTLEVVCFFVIAKGFIALHTGNFHSPFLMEMGNDTGGDFYRLRGLGFIADPNDFSQLVVTLIPCVFFFWEPKRTFLNVVRVLLPVSVLVFGMYLAHSRGAMLALLVVILLSVRRKIGTVPAGVLAAVLFGVATVAGWTGGRDVSVEAGNDRLEAWSTGLQLIKHHPIFGVGFGQFSDYYNITAHNSIVVCAAEVGLVGFFCWVMFLVSTLREAVVVSRDPNEKVLTKEERAALPHARWLATQNGPSARLQPMTPVLAYESRMGVVEEAGLPPALMRPGFAQGAGVAAITDGRVPVEEIHRLARLMVISFSGFLVTGWFLSRAYQMTLFLIGGLVAVIYRMGVEQGMDLPRIPMGRLLKLSLYTSIGLIALVYVMLRVQHLVPSWNN